MKGKPWRLPPPLERFSVVWTAGGYEGLCVDFPELYVQGDTLLECLRGILNTVTAIEAPEKLLKTYGSSTPEID